eukprot:8614640-Pyramimonas_sp.AAC.2
MGLVLLIESFSVTLDHVPRDEQEHAVCDETEDGQGADIGSEVGDFGGDPPLHGGHMDDDVNHEQGDHFGMEVVQASTCTCTVVHVRTFCGLTATANET